MELKAPTIETRAQIARELCEQELKSRSDASAASRALAESILSVLNSVAPPLPRH